jgi:tRNA-dihydrouridine synthase
VICIHGRTRGSTKNRRCGPADLTAVATIARTLHAEYGDAVVILSNGNITTTQDVTRALVITNPCSGVMSAEGILANPALFEPLNSGQAASPPGEELVTACSGTEGLQSGTLGNPVEARVRTTSLLALFREYCQLSTQYEKLGGWVALDAYYRRTHGVTAPSAHATAVKDASCHMPTCVGSGRDGSKPAGCTTTAECACSEPRHTSATREYAPESRQIYIARQHLTWMLGKTGHGRTVRYEYIGPQYRKHVHLKDALNNAASLDDLLTIASHCLPGFDN